MDNPIEKIVIDEEELDGIEIDNILNFEKLPRLVWRHGALVITTAQLHSTKSELRFCAGSNPARGVSEICDGENL